MANELIVFPYIPFFQIQAKVIPGAVECITMIIKHNKELKLNFDQTDQLKAQANLKENSPQRNPSKGRFDHVVATSAWRRAGGN